MFVRLSVLINTLDAAGGSSVFWGCLFLTHSFDVLANTENHIEERKKTAKHIVQERRWAMLAAVVQHLPPKFMMSYTYGKVGSTLIHGAFEKLGFQIFRNHQYMQTLWEAKLRASLNERCMIVTSVRNPFDQLMSSFFEYLGSHTGAHLDRSAYVQSPEVLAQDFRNLISRCNCTATEKITMDIEVEGGNGKEMTETWGGCDARMKGSPEKHSYYICNSKWWSTSFVNVTKTHVLDYRKRLVEEKHLLIPARRGKRPCDVLMLRLEDSQF
eukprot:gnl/MRDRNA2_/MRDRNA2_20773_c0_seq1.p1 gnl/MRDRNA2_/MRDRNA2_20773_c0~~gnl/MRDRNA2_/MRDRNA2_20773_c0_seq1.p1  ORF type:complete len:270 (-),score=27.54 gnl/MRDRNA2_/MRDRNA2_20773_c0_seq1:22-831(-)